MMNRNTTLPTVVATVVLATALGHGAVAEPSWTLPPAGYVYRPAPCPETASPARMYKPCEDQMALLAAAMDAARREGKLLLVKLGANWCPSCRSMHAQLTPDGKQSVLGSGTELGKSYRVVELAVSLLSGGKRHPVPSGEAVLAMLAGHQTGFQLRSIPALAIVDPSRNGKVFLRHVDDLTARGAPTGDPKRLSDMLRAAERHVRHGEAAPSEPGWLWRKLRNLLERFATGAVGPAHAFRPPEAASASMRSSLSSYMLSTRSL